MKNNKGFTLIEVIVSLAVLGIISVSFLGALTGHYGYLNSTKRITEDVFLAQQAVELAIDEAEGGGGGYALKERNLFASGLGGSGIKVKYYEVNSVYENRDYYTLVSTIKPEPLDLVELDSLSLNLRQGTNNVSYAYGLNSFNLHGKFNNDNEHKWDHLLNQVEWFVSSSEFNMPLPKSASFDVTQGDNSYYFPIYPRDFELVENETIYKFGASETTVTNITDYAGRHVVFAVTPAAKSGKLGKQLFSKPLFLSGLPVIDNLVAHLDANYIDMLDNTEVNQSNKTVLKWNDISSIVGKTSIDESASNSTAGNRPIVMKTEVGYGYVGQFVRFDTSKTLTLSSQGTNNKTITVISVLNNRTYDDALYLTNGTQNQLKVAITQDDEELQNWVIEKEVIYSRNNNFTLGGSAVDIAEMIIYTGEPSEEDYDKVLNYLVEKYRTPIVMGDIEAIDDIEKTIIVNTPFELPTSVMAHMSRGYDKYVSMTWDGDYDVSTPGTYEIKGSTVANPTIKMIYTLNVTN